MKKTSLLLSLLVAFSAVVGGTAPAQAADYAVAANPNSALARDAVSTAVTLTGVPAKTGLYVMYCARGTDAQARPTQCFGRGVWVSTDPTSLGQGAVDANLPVTLPVARNFTAAGATVDCEQVSCGVYVRRDHLAPTDYSLDRYQVITFVPLVAPAIAVSAGKGKVLFTVTGYNGKSLTVTVGKKSITKAVTSDNFKFFVGGTGNKSAKVTVLLDGTELLSKTVKIKSKK